MPAADTVKRATMHRRMHKTKAVYRSNLSEIMREHRAVVKEYDALVLKQQTEINHLRALLHKKDPNWAWSD